MKRWPGLTFACLLILFGATSLLSQSSGRAIVLGVDGFDHRVCRELMAKGELPNLSALEAEGGFHPLEPTNPAQSPTSWASLATGRNPGETRIFGFLRRRFDEENRIVPEVALAEREKRTILSRSLRGLLAIGCLLVALLPVIVRRTRRGAIVSLTLGVALGASLAWFFAQVPHEVVVPKARLEGDPFWSALDREGVAAISLFAPLSFPAPKLEQGRLLCGLGVPDLRGTSGSVALYRAGTVPGSGITQMGGRIIQLRPQGGSFVAEVQGPKDARKPEAGPLEKSLRLTPLREGTFRLTVDGQAVVLEADSFSDFIPISFAMGAFVRVEGLVRFRMIAGMPNPSIYQEPIQFDPRRPHPLAPITSPLEYGRDLAQDGPFETLGWATATNPYQDLLIDDAAFLEDAVGVFRRRRSILMRELKKKDYRVAFAVLSTPDRVQHMFWRLRDPEHPAHRPLQEGEEDPILAVYRRIDEVVGEIRAEVIEENDLFMVVSDHGFASFRRAMNLNRWLAREGYLVSKLGARKPEEQSLESGLGQAVFANVDWSKTKAYSLGLGRIWLNRKGREKQGIVGDSEAETLMREIADKLLAERDESRRVVHSVALAQKIYRGPYLDEASDLIVGFERGYRVSWNSCLGGLDHSVFFDNQTRWSGDHCSVDPTLVPGVLFSNRKLSKSEGARVIDVYPTLRDFLGLPPGGGLDGKSLK